jgi:plasmid stabilization system protein ParE
VTPRVVFRPEARRELLEARRWYEERIAGLGLEFARAVEGAIDAIREHPQSFRQVHGEHRRCLVRRFPYSVVYRPTSTEIVVIAVHHHRRAPSSWRGRTA